MIALAPAPKGGITVWNKRRRRGQIEDLPEYKGIPCSTSIQLSM